MKRRYRIPARLRWRTEPIAEENTRLRRAIIAAIRRAVEGLAGEAPEIVVADFEAQAPARERFSMRRYRPDREPTPSPAIKTVASRQMRHRVAARTPIQALFSLSSQAWVF
jgi:hypothetical protein